nr:uncharacterized protein LOC132764881 [Anolis sagrei ordinatus]
MENFEYSIRLNDRDWAEFYLASEECSLIQPALATADEPLLSDLEEGELEQIRWGAVPTHDTAGCLSHIAPDAHLLTEDFLSGSKDETELGSDSRFLCHDNPSNTVLSSWIQESQLSGVTSKHLGSQFGMATLTTENEAAKERDLEMGNWSKNSDCSSVPTIQERHLQEQRLGKETMERPLSMTLDASVGMDGTARENRSETISLQLQPPQNDALQTTSASSQSSTYGTVAAENVESLWQRDPITYPCSPGVSSPGPTELEGISIYGIVAAERDPITYPCSPGVFSPGPTKPEGISTYGTVAAENVESLRKRDPITYPCSPGVSSPRPSKPERISTYGMVAAENVESLRQRDPITYPCSSGVSSPRPTKPEGTKNPEKSSKDLQIVSLAQPTPFHEKPSQRYPGTANWAPTHLLPENPIEGPQERENNGGENALNSIETDRSNVLKERDQAGQKDRRERDV